MDEASETVHSPGEIQLEDLDAVFFKQRGHVGDGPAAEVPGLAYPRRGQLTIHSTVSAGYGAPSGTSQMLLVMSRNSSTCK